MSRRHETQVRRGSLAERREARRGQLLRAAIDVIRREGAGVTMEEMATAGGISKPILYRHFTDRDGLVSAITETALVALAELLEEKLGETRTTDPPDSIRATIDAFFEYIERDPELYRFIAESDARRGNVATIAFTEQIARQVAASLADGLVAFGFDPKPSDVWGRAIVGMVQNTAWWWLDGRPISRGEAVETLTNLVWVGFVGTVSGTTTVRLPPRVEQS